MATCRFCDTSDYDESNMVRYGIRHYAHFSCYLDHKPLSDLPAWKIRQFPFRLLQDRALLDEAEKLTREVAQ